jgi:hypothetical protein
MKSPFDWLIRVARFAAIGCAAPKTGQRRQS